MKCLAHIITETLPDSLPDDAHLEKTMQYVREVAASYDTGLLPPPVAQDCPLYNRIWLIFCMARRC